MRVSNLLQVSCLLGLMSVAHAQLSPAQEQEVRDALHRKIAEAEGIKPASSPTQSALLVQAQQYLRDGRLTQSKYDALAKRIKEYETNRQASALAKIQDELGKAARKPLRETPAAQVNAQERISLHQQQRGAQSGEPSALIAKPAAPSQPATAQAAAPNSDPNAAVVRELEARVRREFPGNTTATPAAKPATPSTPTRETAKPAPAPAKSEPKPVATKSTPAEKPAPVKKEKEIKPAAEKPKKAEPKPAAAKKEQTAKPAPTTSTTAAPAATATPPAPKTKREKLADLLERYKADKVTPTQYQEERAKILAEP